MPASWLVKPAAETTPLTESVVAKLGDGFVLGGVKDYEWAPGDGENFIPALGMVSATGMTAKEDLNDLEGNKIGEILYQSNNINKLQRRAQRRQRRHDPLYL